MQDAFAKIQLSALAVEPPILMAVSIADKPKTLRSAAKPAKPSLPISQPELVEQLPEKTKLNIAQPMPTPFQQASQRADSFELVGTSSELGEGVGVEQPAPDENGEFEPSSEAADQPISYEVAGGGKLLALLFFFD